MGFNLAQIARQRGIRRKSVTLRPILPTSAQARELAAILAPAWQVWRDAEERIMAGYDPAPMSDSLTLDSPASIEQAIEETAAEFLRRLVSTVTPSLRRWGVRTELWHRSKWAAAVQAGTTVDLSTVLTAQPVAETLDLWLARNVALCRNISDQAQARIADAVFRGYQQRTPAREVAAAIREATGMARDRSVRIASDQSAKLSAALDAERQAEAGIEKVKWRSSHKLHPRSWHAARDGKVFYLRSRKPVDGGESVPADDWVGRPPFCGCKAQAYLDLFGDI